jgi:hypothetical protein
MKNLTNTFSNILNALRVEFLETAKNAGSVLRS